MTGRPVAGQQAASQPASQRASQQGSWSGAAVDPQALLLRRGSGGDVAATAAVVAAAFATLHASAWLVPEPARRPQVLAEVFAIHIANALDHGEVHLLTTEPVGHTAAGPVGDAPPPAGEVLAAAVWIDRTRPIPAPPDDERRLHVAAGRDVARFRRLDDLFDQHHPLDEPHHHLAFLGTHPDHQGRGFGTRLLQHHLRDLDAAGIAAYLEAADTRNPPFYARHGFVSLDRAFQLPNRATFTPMWREPAPTP